MSGASLRDSQLAMARYLRDPDGTPAPTGIEQRRLDIYRGLVYNNIEGFLSKGFPVLRSLYDDADWGGLVRAFIDGHSCHTPYFLEISQEFLQFLMEEHSPRAIDPPFMAELAHYEWAELALDVAEETLPEPLATGDILAAIVQLSPLAWLLSYQFPVHHIGPGFRPEEAGEPSYLVVYRDRQEEVHFMELNPATARLVELTRDNTTATARELLAVLATEMGQAAESMLDYGAGQLAELVDLEVLVVIDGSGPGQTSVARPTGSA